jgi:isoaspartyl peptidase/L-asparaginase-like protein (Ntn-hydrolase superfamily)
MDLARNVLMARPKNRGNCRFSQSFNAYHLLNRTVFQSSFHFMYTPRILVHLGASDLPVQFHAEALKYAREAVKVGAEVAATDASAEDIVSATVSVLEDCPVTDAGFGSFFNAQGEHQMDAGLMTGDKRYGAVCSVHSIRNPIKAARLMVDDTRFSILVGEGAMDFVRKHNFEMYAPEEFKTSYNVWVREQFEGDPLGPFASAADHGTVGCVVRDSHGRIAAGTSTGGTPFAPRGRVGDSPFPGCGVWADDADACCSCTGYGEAILTELLAAQAARQSQTMGAMEAAKAAITAFSKSPKALGGVIMIVKGTGEYGLFHNTEHMPFAMLNDDLSITAGVSVCDLH